MKMTHALPPIQTAGLPVSLRRKLVIALNLLTLAPLAWFNYTMFAPGGIDLLEGVILFCAAICIPWTVVSFWNAVIGLIIIAFGKPEKSIYPYFDATGPLPELNSLTALTVFMRNEDPTPIFERLHAMRESLRQTGRLHHFRFVLLSDTDQPAVMQMEDEAFARIQNSLGMGMAQPPVYRRRAKNTGYKAGNIKDYLDTLSEGDEFFVPLDSDSAMSGDLLVRMVSTIENQPRIGLLQTLAAGTPAISAFTRFFQFGLRHSMRAFNMGNIWWTADCALYWGHNAIIRTRAFHAHCMLPILPGKPPLGGYILSHDLMEAMFMRRGGYEVRLIPIETESYETNPPTFLEFLRRELRWCQGNMQYWFMLKEPGLLPVSRFQVMQTLAMYVAPAAWVLLTLVSITKALLGGFNASEVNLSFTLLLTIIAINFFPKLAGITDTACTGLKRYGGALRFSISALIEIIIMTIIAPAIAVAITVFLCGLLMGKSISWNGQNRDRLGIRWRDALRVFWPQVLMGFGLMAILASQDMVAFLWALPFIIGLCLVVPFAVITASPRTSHLITRMRLFMIPEENNLPPLLSLLVAPEVLPTAEEKDTSGVPQTI